MDKPIFFQETPNQTKLKEIQQMIQLTAIDVRNCLNLQSNLRLNSLTIALEQSSSLSSQSMQTLMKEIEIWRRVKSLINDYLQIQCQTERKTPIGSYYLLFAALYYSFFSN
jgi:hypothetical protein